MERQTGKYIILFDGLCNLCNGTVQFVLPRDKKKQFFFGSLQGRAGQQYLQHFGLPQNQLNSFILLEGEKYYTRSAGVLRVLKHLGGGWRLLYAFIVIPRFIRDAIYKWVARNRYKWFGKREECPVPDAAVKERFLD